MEHEPGAEAGRCTMKRAAVALAVTWPLSGLPATAEPGKTGERGGEPRPTLPDRGERCAGDGRHLGSGPNAAAPLRCPGLHTGYVLSQREWPAARLRRCLPRHAGGVSGAWSCAAPPRRPATGAPARLDDSGGVAAMLGPAFALGLGHGDL